MGGSIHEIKNFSQIENQTSNDIRTKILLDNIVFIWAVVESHPNIAKKCSAYGRNIVSFISIEICQDCMMGIIDFD